MKVMNFDCLAWYNRGRRLLAPRYAACLLLVLAAPWLPAAAYQSKTAAPGNQPPASSNRQQTPSKPSLDALVQRAKSYWSLLAQSNKRRAMEYVELSCRDYFLSRPFPGFSKPQVTKLEFGDSEKEVAVTATVRRRLGTLPGEFDYPVMNRWVFARGNWWVIIRDEPSAEALGMHSAPGRSISPAEVEKRRAFVRSHLRFASDTIDFGTVRKGEWVEFAIDYQWTGDQPVEAALQPGPIALFGFSEQKLLPGPDQRIPLKTQMLDYEGQYQQAFSMLVTYERVGVSYEFILHGNVYIPVSIIPPVLRFREGEREKEVEITNNSSSEVRLGSFRSDAEGYDLYPLPQSILPGGRSMLKVRVLTGASEKNHADAIDIIFAKPVEEMSRLRLTVVTNAGDEPKQKGIKELTSKEVEELMRKSGQNPIKP
jgi:hypothetical protein